MNWIKQNNKKINLKKRFKHGQKGVGLEKNKKQMDANRRKHMQKQDE